MEVLERPGRRAKVLASRDEFVLLEFDMDPQADGAAPHFHRRHVDSFYVLEGQLELTVADEVVLAQSGELVHAAPEVVHSFRNSSDDSVRLLNLHTPGMCFDEYIGRMDAKDPGLNPSEYDVFEVD